MSILAFSQSQARAEKEKEEKEKEKEEQDRVRQEHIQEQHRQECSRIKKMLQDANEGQTYDAFEKWVIGLPINSEIVYKLQMISNKDTLETIMNAVIPGNLSYPILSYPILSYPILSYPILSYPILSYPILSYPILSYPILSYPILSYPILSYPILSYPILSYPILSYPILSYPILSYPILSYPILSYPILSYPILSYPILSYPILSYPILSYPILSCLYQCPSLMRYFPGVDMGEGGTLPVKRPGSDISEHQPRRNRPFCTLSAGLSLLCTSWKAYSLTQWVTGSLTQIFFLWNPCKIFFQIRHSLQYLILYHAPHLAFQE